MKQWDIFLFPFPTLENPHPGVIISNDGICSNPHFEAVNVLVCQTVRPPTRKEKDHEVYLTEADGFDWKTLVKCDFVHVFPKADALEKRGEVCPQHISAIRMKLARFF